LPDYGLTRGALTKSLIVFEVVDSWWDWNQLGFCDACLSAMEAEETLSPLGGELPGSNTFFVVVNMFLVPLVILDMVLGRCPVDSLPASWAAVGRTCAGGAGSCHGQRQPSARADEAKLMKQSVKTPISLCRAIADTPLVLA
jgi:hypothetical protein